MLTAGSWEVERLARWPVAVQCAAAVGADGGDGAVGVQAELPTPPVHGDQMMKVTQRQQVVQAGGAPIGAAAQVVDVARPGGPVAPGEPAPGMAGAD